jgi:hypothetical protein
VGTSSEFRLAIDSREGLEGGFIERWPGPIAPAAGGRRFLANSVITSAIVIRRWFVPKGVLAASSRASEGDWKTENSGL